MRSDGLKIKLVRIPGVTDKRLLPVPYYFQCPPTDTFTLNYGHESQTYSVIPTGTSRGGQYKRVGGRKLRAVSFSTIVVDWAEFMIRSHQDANAANGYDSLQDLVERLQHMAENGSPVHLLAAHDWADEPEIDFYATMPDLALHEQGGEPDARYADVSFEEWRDPVVQGKSSKKQRRGGKSWPKTHVLDDDDTLYGLAKTYYGKDGAGRVGAEAIARTNAIASWGFGTPLVQSKRFKKGDKIKIEQLPISATMPIDVRIGLLEK